MTMKKRCPHFLKAVHGSRLPVQVATLAVGESVPGVDASASLCLARLRDGAVTRQTVSSTSVFDALRALATMCRRGSSTWLVVRDLYATFVRIGWFDLMEELGWTITRAGKDETGQLVHEPGCCYLICRRRDGGKLTCVDPGNYGVKEFPGWTSQPVHNAELLMSWWAGWLRWLAQHDAGSLRLTLASQAHYCFRKRFYAGNIWIHNNEKALQLEQDALHGGRCEAFKIGEIKGPVYHLDARSLYGAMASLNDMPVSLVAYCHGAPRPELLGDNLPVSDVTVCTDAPAVPARVNLLVGMEPDKRLNGLNGEACRPIQQSLTIYPTGTFRAVLCGPEMEMIADKIIRIHRTALYRPAPIFREWGRWNWDRRAEALRDGDIVIARQLKSWSQFCYGKWAARYRGWRHDPKGVCATPWELWYELDRENCVPVPHRAVAGRAEVYEDEGLSPSACPIITAWINSLARVWLWRAMESAGRDHVYYVDTDSLMVDAHGLGGLRDHGFIVGDDLGQLRLVGEYRHVRINGWKHYVADGIETCAGDATARRGAIIDEIPGEPAEPITIACAARRPPRSATEKPDWRRMTKYRHGRVASDGTVTPHHLEAFPCHST